jgi:hypothetical protein
MKQLDSAKFVANHWTLVYIVQHRLNMGIRSPKFIWAPVYSCTHWLKPRDSPPPPAFGLIYEGAVGQPR